MRKDNINAKYKGLKLRQNPGGNHLDIGEKIFDLSFN
jgi:hypothetical protein